MLTVGTCTPFTSAERGGGSWSPGVTESTSTDERMIQPREENTCIIRKCVIILFLPSPHKAHVYIGPACNYVIDFIKVSDRMKNPFSSQEQGTANVPLLVAMEIMGNVNSCKCVALRGTERKKFVHIVSFINSGYSSVSVCVSSHTSTFKAFSFLFFLLL